MHVTRPPRQADTWLDQVTDLELRCARPQGYRPGAQARSLATTRRLIDAVWVEMVEHPSEPVRIQAVLDRSEVSSSSFYDRFDSLRVLVELAGLLHLSVGERCRSEIAESGPAPGWSAGHGVQEVTGAVVHEIVASCTPTAGVPREVLAVGVWSDAYVRERTIDRNRR